MEQIIDGMDYNDWSRTWLLICEQKGHLLQRLDGGKGEIDIFAHGLGTSHHNGPRCVKCQWEACMHCDPFAEKIPQCDQT